MVLNLVKTSLFLLLISSLLGCKANEVEVSISTKDIEKGYTSTELSDANTKVDSIEVAQALCERTSSSFNKILKECKPEDKSTCKSDLGRKFKNMGCDEEGLEKKLEASRIEEAADARRLCNKGKSIGEWATCESAAKKIFKELGGDEAEFDQIAEKKDACYHKVKSRYKVWPSAYASGALVRCRKVGAKNWGNKSKK